MSKKIENTIVEESDKLETKPKKNTLSDYIDDNSKLISVLGVFTALTVFTRNFTIEPIGYLLSFVFLTLSIIVWLELWTKFPKKPSSWRLLVFENVLSFSVLGIILYWLLAYRDIWRSILPFPIFLVLISLLSYPITKYKVLEKLMGLKLAQYKIVKILFGLVLILLLGFIAEILSLLIAYPVNNTFDQMRNEIDSIFIYKK